MSESLGFGELIIGPAGSGKSTYCKIMQDYASFNNRNICVVNLDPAAESFLYDCEIGTFY